MAQQDVELSFDSVKDFMVLRGGRVTNHELVKHFKSCLTNTDNKGKKFIQIAIYE